MLIQQKRALRALANAIESRDAEHTLRHVEAANAYAQAIGLELGWNQDDLVSLEFGAILYDIGEIGIPEKVLLKSGALDEYEWAEMRCSMGKSLATGGAPDVGCQQPCTITAPLR